MNLAPPLPAVAGSRVRACKICGAPSPVFGSVDFNRCCEEHRGLRLPDSGTAIAYNHCPSCGFLFTDAFEHWQVADYEAAIYNDGYARVDPDFREARPVGNAKLVLNLFRHRRIFLSVLDYGGGNGLLARLLEAYGFPAPATYDPFTPGADLLPRRTFHVVTCFETMEHVPDPVATVERLAALVGSPGFVVFSTLLQPADFAARGLGWWYVAPRNGHISMHSRGSLALLWKRIGFQVGSFSQGMHCAYREVPAFARHLVRP